MSEVPLQLSFRLFKIMRPQVNPRVLVQTRQLLLSAAKVERFVPRTHIVNSRVVFKRLSVLLDRSQLRHAF